MILLTKSYNFLKITNLLFYLTDRVSGKIDDQNNGGDPFNLGGSRGGYRYWSLII